MVQYIDKAKVVAELERLITELVEEGEDTMFEQGRISAFEDVKVFINHTLEVKEVDIASMADDYYDALIKEAEMGVDMAGHCRLAYYNGCKDVLNKIQKGE